MVNRWVQPGEELEVSDREEDWRDYFGAYLEPVTDSEPADAPEKKRRRRKSKEVSEEAPGPEQGEQDFAPVVESESEAEPTEEIDQADEAPAVEAVPE